MYDACELLDTSKSERYRGKSAATQQEQTSDPNPASKSATSSSQAESRSDAKSESVPEVEPLAQSAAKSKSTAKSKPSVKSKSTAKSKATLKSSSTGTPKSAAKAKTTATSKPKLAPELHVNKGVPVTAEGGSRSSAKAGKQNSGKAKSSRTKPSGDLQEAVGSGNVTEMTYREFWQQRWHELKAQDPSITLTDAHKRISHDWRQVKANREALQD